MTTHSKRSSPVDDEQQPSRKRLRMSIVPKSDDEESNKNVRVVARVRPLSAMEADKRSVLTSSNTSILVENGDSRSYDYDAVFGPESTQIEVYQQSGAKDAVCKDILQGFNCTILAYGQTGSGKTCKCCRGI
jgi:kinesin family protein 11